MSISITASWYASQPSLKKKWQKVVPNNFELRKLLANLSLEEIIFSHGKISLQRFDRKITLIVKQPLLFIILMGVVIT